MTDRYWTTPGPETPQAIELKGQQLLRDPLLNKGSAFTVEERRALALEGFLPSRVNTMEQQADRIYARIAAHKDPFEKYQELAALQDRNEHLYYRILGSHLRELMPVVYTPTVGQATRQFSRVFRRGRGIWITPDHRGRIAEVLRSAVAGRDIRLIVATDNESILGIGDQGAGGMAISIGKLALYCAGAGIHPALTLPVSLDVGTDNVSLLDDPLYIGWPHRRLRADAYHEVITEFAEAVSEVFPKALLQWEDFRKDRALTILEKFRGRLLSFNDDIQGTGAVTVAGILAGMRKIGGRLADQRFVIHGAGAAGLGIARQIRAALAEEGGEPSQVVALDSRGLLVAGDNQRDAYKTELALAEDKAAALGLGDPASRDLLSVVKAYRPTVLIGTSGQPGAFSRAVIEAMAEECEQPIVMPFSNPTDQAEARPEEVIRWTGGQALVAAGSPFADVEFQGRTIRIGQGNNVFIFPGLGMGSLLSGADLVSDAMISASSHAVAEMVTDEELESGMLYPRVGRLREVCRNVAAAVMAAAGEGGADTLSPDEIGRRLDAASWEPAYRPYMPA